MIKIILFYFKYLFYKIIKKDILTTGYYKYLYSDGHNTYLLNYELNENSIVFDIGGYIGVFSDKIIKLFNPYVFIFEPVKSHYSILENKYKTNSKIKIYNFGLLHKTLSTEIILSGEGSSIYENKFFGQSNIKKERIELKSILTFINENSINEIDLMTINIEGGEYDLLPFIIETGLINKIKNIQIQFHFFYDLNYHKKREQIIQRLLLTHKIKFAFPFVWEGFTKINNSIN